MDRPVIGVPKRELAKVIEGLREIRFDVRTGDTHPIIGNGRVLCTYPFPLLSPRALVESRAEFVTLDCLAMWRVIGYRKHFRSHRNFAPGC
jgi:hypothetical protein